MSKSSTCGPAMRFVAAAVLVLPLQALAASFGYPGGTVTTYARNIFGATDTVLTPNAPLVYDTGVSDNLAGRSTGFAVRLVLEGGASFDGTPPTVVFDPVNLQNFTAGTVAAAASASAASSAPCCATSSA